MKFELKMIQRISLFFQWYLLRSYGFPSEPNMSIKIIYKFTKLQTFKVDSLNDIYYSGVLYQIIQLLIWVFCNATISSQIDVYFQRIMSSGCVESLLDTLICSKTRSPVLVEVTGALAVLADDGMRVANRNQKIKVTNIPCAVMQFNFCSLTTFNKLERLIVTGVASRRMRKNYRPTEPTINKSCRFFLKDLGPQNMYQYSKYRKPNKFSDYRN